MTFLGADLHPIAEAVLRYYLDALPTAAEASEDEVLGDLFDLVNRLDPEKVVVAGQDLLAVARFLHAKGRYEAATRLSRRLDVVTQRALQRAGAAAAIDVETRDSGEKFGRFANGAPSRVVESAPAGTAPSTTETSIFTALDNKWSKLTDVERARLKRLANELSATK